VESKTRNFNVRLPNVLVEKLDDYALKERRSRNEVIRFILEDFFSGKLVKLEEKPKEAGALRAAF